MSERDTAAYLTLQMDPLEPQTGGAREWKALATFHVRNDSSHGVLSECIVAELRDSRVWTFKEGGVRHRHFERSGIDACRITSVPVTLQLALVPGRCWSDEDIHIVAWAEFRYEGKEFKSAAIRVLPAEEEKGPGS